MIKNICFYNHWHNGDVFAGKAFVRMLQQACPDFHYMYALAGDPYIIKDLNCDCGHVNQLPPQITDRIMGAVDQGTLFINTWIGVYMHQVALPGEHHGNYPSLYRMWAHIYSAISEILQVGIRMPDNVWCSVSTTDWSAYNCAPADQFVHTHATDKKLLFCNGAVRSGQSAWGDLQDVTHALAQAHEDWQIICTHKFDTQLPNIHFTSDLFQQPCDINEIAYLSTKCDFIWGKNSGPYMFCHVTDNLFNPKKVFFSCSDRASDSYVHGCGDLNCDYYHSLTHDTQTLVDQITNVMHTHREPPYKMQVLT